MGVAAGAQLLLDDRGQIAQPVAIFVGEVARPADDYAKRSGAGAIGHEDWCARVEPHIGWARDDWIIGEAIVAQGVGDHQHLALGDRVRAERHFAGRFLQVGSNARFEPLAVGVDQTNLVGSAFAKAVQPFLIWDAVKMLFAALTVTGLWSLFKKPV